MRILIFALFVIVSCDKFKKTENVARIETLNEVAPSNGIDLEVYDFNGFKKFLEEKDGKVHVINFWATWCAPCVKELPYFEKINEDYRDENVKVLLVSLDFPHLYESKLKPFIINKKIQSKVIALDDADMNTWIPKVNSKWSGSIPATIIYKNGESKFYEQSFTYEELQQEIKHFLK